MAIPKITLRETLDEAGRIAHVMEPVFNKLPSQINIKSANEVNISWTAKVEDVNLNEAIEMASQMQEPLSIQHCKDFYIFSINILNLPF